MRVLRKYRLELHWNKVEYATDDLVTFQGAYLCGPVLKEAAQLQEEDSLILDMTDQHLIHVPDYYQAILRWKGVDYKEDRIFLKEVELKGRYVNSIDTLKDTDFILINCQGHDTADYSPKQGRKVAPGMYVQNYKHSLVYFAEVCTSDKESKL